MRPIILLLLVLAAIYFFSQSLDDSDKNPDQEDIQTLQFVKDENGKAVSQTLLETDGLPYPQISRGFKQLSRGELPKPLNNLKKLLPDGPAVLPIFRETEASLTKKRMYLPDYYRKDTMPMNDIGSEEMRPFVTDDDVTESSWTDDNVSEHPKFYSATMKNDKLTDIGSFFDKNNQYNDTTSPNTYPLPSDKCYVDKQGHKFCLDNTRLQMVPPALITDPKSCYALNPVGMYKDYQRIPDDPNRVMNGGNFYGSKASIVRGSEPLGSNESFDAPLNDPQGSCEL